MLSRAYIKAEYFLQNQGKITFILARGMTWHVKRNEKMFSKCTKYITYKVLCFTRKEETKGRKVAGY